MERKFFTITTKIWFILVFMGQLIFAYYILMLYWKSAIHGNYQKWNTASHNYINGDTIGNLVFGLHVAFAAIITIIGPLQFIPATRRAVPKLHRVCGRIYIFSAFLMAIGGLYMSWGRSITGGTTAAVIISANAIIVLVSAYFTIVNAIKRKIEVHQQWAIRLFVAVSGVWFFRVFFMLWVFIFKAPVGFDPVTFTGPFLVVLSISVYVFPQLFVQFYFAAKKTNKPSILWIFNFLLTLITIGTAIGIIIATLGLWIPRIK
jgi:hypothetical protein